MDHRLRIKSEECIANSLLNAHGVLEDCHPMDGLFVFSLPVEKVSDLVGYLRIHHIVVPVFLLFEL